MRILLVAFHFPPYNFVGAIRPGKLAKYLVRQGHEIRVLTAANQPYPADLPLEIPQELVSYTPWWNLTYPAEVWRRSRLAADRSSLSDGRRRPGAERHALRTVYRWTWRGALFPDQRVGWYPYAMSAGRRLLAGWRPEVIYATAGPLTPLYVARRLAREAGVPWVIEFRDLWVDNPTYRSTFPAWRRPLDRGSERALVTGASGVVTSSPLMSEKLVAKYGREVETVLNGFDPEDFPREQPRNGYPQRLRLVFTGSVYDQGHTLAPLVEGLRELGPEADRVRCCFYGRNLRPVEQARRDPRVGKCFEVHAPVAYPEALRLQTTADALLLLVLGGPQDHGQLHAKLYEYLGARRPVLVVGTHADLASRMITDRRAGTFAADGPTVARQLRAWLLEKRETGEVRAPAEAMLADLTREHQARRLAAYLDRVIDGYAREDRVESSASPPRPGKGEEESRAGQRIGSLVVPPPGG